MPAIETIPQPILLEDSVDVLLPDSPVIDGHLKMGGSDPVGNRIDVNSHYLTWNGRPWMPTMGEMPFFLCPASCWHEELLKAKAGGIDIIGTYICWGLHEPEPGFFHWEGQANLRNFLEACRDTGLWVMLRVGPFIHGERRNGGLPDWLYGEACHLRSNDARYLAFVERYFKALGQQVSGLLFGDGGPVIGFQLENEFMATGAPWETTHLPDSEWVAAGSGGVDHMRALRACAERSGLLAPLWTVTGWQGAPVPEDEMLPMFGGYAYHGWIEPPAVQKPTDCFLYLDRKLYDVPARHNVDTRRVPRLTCELGSGMETFYRYRPIVDPRSAEPLANAALGCGGNLPGFYVYHGGCHDLKAAGNRLGNEYRVPRISYDFQAPLGEFGQRRLHYHTLRRQLLFIRAIGQKLAPMISVIPESQTCMKPEEDDKMRWCVRSNGVGGFVFLNNFQDHRTRPIFEASVISLQSQGETYRFPSEGALRLETGMSAIFPYNIDLDGIRLKQASCCILSRHQPTGGPAHWLFHTVDGIAPELLFAPGIQAIGGEGSIDHGPRDTVRLRPIPGRDSCWRISNGADSILLTVLKDSESLSLWQGALSSGEYLVWTEAGCTFDGATLRLSQMDSPLFHAEVWQPDRGWTRYPVQSTPRVVRWRREDLEPGKTALYFEPGSLATDTETLLRIHCTGDVAMAFIRGRLVHDQFCNGRIWEIGLRRFADELRETPLVLKISPPPKSGEAQLQPMATHRVAGTDGLEVGDIAASLEYRATLQPI